MAEYGEALIAVRDGRSHGTRNIIQLARRFGLQVFVYRVDHASEAIEAREMQQGFCVGWTSSGLNGKGRKQRDKKYPNFL
jgi:hypothetical protein